MAARKALALQVLVVAEHVRHVHVHRIVQIELGDSEHPVQLEPLDHQFRSEMPVTVRHTDSKIMNWFPSGRENYLFVGGVVSAPLAGKRHVIGYRVCRRKLASEGVLPVSLVEKHVSVRTGFVQNRLYHHRLFHCIEPYVAEGGHVWVVGRQDYDPYAGQKSSRRPIIVERGIDVGIALGRSVKLPYRVHSHNLARQRSSAGWASQQLCVIPHQQIGDINMEILTVEEGLFFQHLDLRQSMFRV